MSKWLIKKIKIPKYQCKQKIDFGLIKPIS